MALRSLIVDDDPSFLEAATLLLEREGLAVVGVASTTDDALRQAQVLRPDVVVVDVMLGGESGFDLARRLAGVDPRPAVLLTSTYTADDFADLIADAPAAGFVPKPELSANAIRRLVDPR